MNDKSESNSGASPILPNKFIVAGVSITSLRRQLKPALPKKRQENSSVVVITSRAGSITISIAGAAVEMPAMTSGPFIAELPYIRFKYLLTEHYEAGALIEFKFAAGAFTVGQLTIRSPEIVVVPAKQKPNSNAEHVFPVDTALAIANPLDAPLGAPLLAAYKYIRRFGIQPLVVSKTFADQQLEVDKILNKCDRLMQPFGVTRADLERLLDQKAGV